MMAPSSFAMTTAFEAAKRAKQQHTIRSSEAHSAAILKKRKMVAFWRDAPYFVTVASMALVTLARVVNISLLFLFYDFFFGILR